MSSYLTPEKVIGWRIVKWTLANAQDQEGKKSKPNRLDWSLSCSPMIPQRTEHSWEAHSIETSSAPLNPAFHSFTMQLSYFLGETQRDSSGDRWWWGVYLNWKKKAGRLTNCWKRGYETIVKGEDKSEWKWWGKSVQTSSHKPQCSLRTDGMWLMIIRQRERERGREIREKEEEDEVAITSRPYAELHIQHPLNHRTTGRENKASF